MTGETLKRELKMSPRLSYADFWPMSAAILYWVTPRWMTESFTGN